MKLYQYTTLVDRLKKYYSKQMSMIIDLNEKILLAEETYNMAEFIEKELSSNNETSLFIKVLKEASL